MTSILDPSFKYTKAADTDIRKTFARQAVPDTSKRQDAIQFVADELPYILVNDPWLSEPQIVWLTNLGQQFLALVGENARLRAQLEQKCP